MDKPSTTATTANAAKSRVVIDQQCKETPEEILKRVRCGELIYDPTALGTEFCPQLGKGKHGSYVFAFLHSNPDRPLSVDKLWECLFSCYIYVISNRDKISQGEVPHKYKKKFEEKAYALIDKYLAYVDAKRAVYHISCHAAIGLEGESFMLELKRDLANKLWVWEYNVGRESYALAEVKPVPLTDGKTLPIDLVHNIIFPLSHKDTRSYGFTSIPVSDLISLKIAIEKGDIDAKYCIAREIISKCLVYVDHSTNKEARQMSLENFSKVEGQHNLLRLLEFVSDLELSYHCINVPLEAEKNMVMAKMKLKDPCELLPNDVRFSMYDELTLRYELYGFTSIHIPDLVALKIAVEKGDIDAKYDIAKDIISKCLVYVDSRENRAYRVDWDSMSKLCVFPRAFQVLIGLISNENSTSSERKHEFPTTINHSKSTIKLTMTATVIGSEPMKEVIEVDNSRGNSWHIIPRTDDERNYFLDVGNMLVHNPTHLPHDIALTISSNVKGIDFLHKIDSLKSDVVDIRASLEVDGERTSLYGGSMVRFRALFYSENDNAAMCIFSFVDRKSE